MRLLLGLVPWLAAGKIIGALGAAPAAWHAGVYDGFSLGLFVALILAFGVVGGALVVGSAHDERAWDLGVVLLLTGSQFADSPLSALARASSSYAPWMALLQGLRPDALQPVYLWRFAAAFPREAPYGWPRRMPEAVGRVALPVGLVLFAGALVLSGYDAGLVAGAPAAWLAALGPSADPGIYWILVLSLMLPALPFMVWRARAASPAERRRVRLLVTGLVVGIGPMALEVLVELLVPSFGALMSTPSARRAGGFVLYPLMLSTPVSTAYAVAVRQVLDVRLVLRRALQYALTKAAILAALAAPFAVLVWYLVRDPGGSGPRLLWLAGLTVAGLLTMALRVRILEVLDRRFFREHYDGQRILASLIERASRAESAPVLMALLRTEIDRALHVERVAGFVLEPGGRWVEEPGAVWPSLEAQGSLATLLRGSAEPMDVDLEAQSTPLLRLPAEDRQWLAECGFRLLVPLVSQDGLLVGLIGLGQKKSDLPFSADDRHLLGAIAASGAMALDRFRLRTPHAESPGVVTGAVASEDAASECRACGLVLDAALATCPSCSGPAVAAPVPRVLRGTFQFEKRLGVGGMGVVYRATDLTLGRVVAVKTLPALSPERVMRLRREAFAMAAVSHPHLATIFGAEMWRGTPLLIVEYLDGGTLADRLRTGWLPVAEVIDLGIAIAGAVGRLHAQGLLHRDVKPSNIGFSSQAGPKLLDFGLAKFLRPPGATAGYSPGQSSPTVSFAVTSSGEVTRALAGTPLYFSPETVRQEPADAGVDLWALALVLFEALTATHPMRAPTLIEVFERIAHGPVPDPRQLRPECPAPLASFLQAALHVDPARRPRSAREFQAGLEAVRARAGA